MEWIAIAGPVIAFLSLCGVIFKWAIINPLNKSIKDLHDLIIETRSYVEKTEEKRQGMETRLTRVEESAKQAHLRLNDLAQEVHHD